MAVSPELRVSKALAVALPKFQVETAKIFDASDPESITKYVKRGISLKLNQREKG